MKCGTSLKPNALGTIGCTDELDEAKPGCERCKKATYICGGYNFDEAPYAAVANQRKAERQAEEQERWNALIPYEAALAHGFLPFESVGRSISLSAFQDDICRSFVLHKLTSGPAVTKGMTWWLSSTPRVQVQAYTLVSASRAMTATFFGRLHQQPSIVAEGERMYVEALHNLAQDVGHDVKSRTIETLGATMALNMYEVSLIQKECRRIGTYCHTVG